MDLGHVQHLVNAIHYHTNGSAAERHNDNAALLVSVLRWQAKHATQADQGQQAVSERHYAKHVRFRVRHMDDMLRYLDNFLHVLNSDGVFLSGNCKAHQLQFIARRFLLDRLALVFPAYPCVVDVSLRERSDIGEFGGDQLGKIQHHDHLVTAHALEQAGQQLGIHGGAD